MIVCRTHAPNTIKSRKDYCNQSMAESKAFLLVQQLQNLLVEYNKLLGGLGLREELRFIKDEFERMTPFLGVADSMEDKDPEIAVWVNQVRGVAQDIEDVLDEYELLFSAHRGRGLVWRIYTFVITLTARYELGFEIQSIQNRVRNISEEHQRCRDRYKIQDQASTSGFFYHTEVDGRGAALLQELVGIDKPKRELITLLRDGDSKFKVVSVVGMGGLGKTTLVKKVYEDKDVRSQFQSHAWVTVSKSFNAKKLLKNLIEQLYPEKKEPVLPEQVQAMDHNELKAFITEFLSHRKSIIVFDDVQDTNSWKDIEHLLPKNSSNCRVMLTTRVMEVALAPCTNSSDNVYKMQPLSPEDSWTLFCNKAFKGSQCPPHLKDVSEKILKKCECLPLAIVAIGGILALKYQRLEDWETVYRSLGGELDGEGKLERLKRILFLSFYDLPYRLKICLLYLSIFREDHEIDCEKVIPLWAAEGFVQEKEGLTSEEVGQHYLIELVNRSLLQVAKTEYDGTLETCRVHDILREIILSKSREQNLAAVLDEKSSHLTNEVRRLAIHGSAENTTKASNNFRHLRSLFLFSRLDPLLVPFISSTCGSSRLLKVLDLRGAPLEMIPDEVFKLFHLRYLSLRNTQVRTTPKSIGKLQNLETLDLMDTFVAELPVEILKLRRLRHLCLGFSKRILNFGASFGAPCKIGNLASLQTLSFIQAYERDGIKIVTEIGKLTQLRTLGITKLRREDGKDLCLSLEKLTNLRELHLISIEIIDLQHTLCATPRLLRSLSLCGRLEKLPQWISSLEGLTECHLQISKLKDEPLQYLEDLPNLIFLDLLDAYEGEALHFKAGKFQRLKDLFWCSLKELRWVAIEKSSMPCLERLSIAECELMEELPSGIEHLSKLETLGLFDMSEKLVRSLQNRECMPTGVQIIVVNRDTGVRFF